MTLFTQLEAVNRMLSSIGAHPVSTLSGPVSPDVSMALDTLNVCVRTLQMEGWKFNSEHAVETTPDAFNEITFPGDVTAVYLSEVDQNGYYINQPDVDIVLRGNKLYDRKNRVYTFDPADSPTVDLIRSLAWDDLPEAARIYATAKAIVLFGNDLTQTAQQRDEARTRELQARAELERQETLGIPTSLRDERYYRWMNQYGWDMMPGEYE